MDDDIIGLDISQLRRTARTTSLVTSGIVSVLVFAAGWMLFSGESAQQSAPHDQSDFKQISQKVESTSNGFEAMRARMQVLQNSVGKLSEAMGNLDGETPFSVRLTMLENQIRQMGGTKLADLASRLQAQVDNPIGNTEWLSAIEQLRSVVMGVQNRTERLEDALGRAQGHNDALGRTLSDLSGRDLSAAAMLLALTQLRSSAEREAPFADDLTLLRTLTAQSDPALAASIDKLGPYAEKGVLSPTGLKRALLASANDIVTAKMRGEDVSIKDKVMGRLSGLFSIKQDGVPVNGSAEQALIQKAISQLDQNDVAGASATLAQLKGPAAAAAAPWQQEAQANLMVEALDGQLVNTLMQRLKSGLTRTRVINLAPRAQATAPSTPVLTNPDMPSMPAPLPATEPQAGQPQELPEMLPPDDGMQEVPGGDIMIQQ